MYAFDVGTSVAEAGGGLGGDGGAGGRWGAPPPARGGAVTTSWPVDTSYDKSY